jgi:two-component system chemotaxis response regulator CheY
MKTCLIVDDSRVIRMASRKMLDELNFTCQEAENGQEALDICCKAMPDVVLLDWNMPVMDGMDCLKGIRGMIEGQFPKIILCTTNSELAQITAALSEGADEYIMKPFDAEIIRSKFIQLGIA